MSLSSKKDALRKASADHARNVLTNMFGASSVRDNTSKYPKFEYGEIILGKVLGKGGFGTVSEILAFDASAKRLSIARRSRGKSLRGGMSLSVSKDDTATSTENDGGETIVSGEMESRKFISDHCIRDGGDCRYALKVLSPDVAADPGSYYQGILDMTVETRMLSDMEHPNIVKMRAIASTDPFDSKTNYFIVMDRLYDTLEKRLKKWLVQRNRRSSAVGKMFIDRKGKKTAALYEERIVAAYDLADAIDYLHKRNIIYRDLKPENIGFDVRGDIKIFDFGLSKELRDEDANGDGTYNLTEMTGSPLYMAPEVANGEPYNDTCDTYSFAILLWEILYLKRPFELYTMKLLRSKVYNGEHKRPPLNDDTASNAAMKLLLKRSWCQDIKERNTMDAVAKILRKEIVRVRNGDESGLEHNRRRSTFVFRRGASRKNSASSNSKNAAVAQ